MPENNLDENPKEFHDGTLGGIHVESWQKFATKLQKKISGAILDKVKYSKEGIPERISKDIPEKKKVGRNS